MKVGESATDPAGRRCIITDIDGKTYTVQYGYGGPSAMWLREDLTPVQPETQQDTHYKKEVQPIDLIDAFNLDFNAGNVIKYVARAKHKENELEDLRKAKYYLDRLYEKAKASKS